MGNFWKLGVENNFIKMIISLIKEPQTILHIYVSLKILIYSHGIPSPSKLIYFMRILIMYTAFKLRD